MPQSARFNRADKVATIYIPVNPRPTARPRVARNGGVFYPKTYRDWRDAANEEVPEGHLHLEGPLLVVVNSVVQRPKTTKLTHPKPDVDNYAKAALDLITRKGGYWDDDYQVTELISTKRWTRGNEEPHTKVEIYQCKDEM